MSEYHITFTPTSALATAQILAATAPMVGTQDPAKWLSSHGLESFPPEVRATLGESPEYLRGIAHATLMFAMLSVDVYPDDPVRAVQMFTHIGELCFGALVTVGIHPSTGRSVIKETA